MIPSFTPTSPYSSASDTRHDRCTLFVNIYAASPAHTQFVRHFLYHLKERLLRLHDDKPAIVSLAILIASSSVLNRIRGATGPNISSLREANKFFRLLKARNTNCF